MSRHTSREHVTVSDNAEALEIIKEEQNSPTSSVNLDTSENQEEIQDADKTAAEHHDPKPRKDHIVCPCKEDEIERQKKRANDLEKMLIEKEEQLKNEFQLKLEKEIELMKDRFNYILQNEQIRTSYMLREAHRERKEKIMALQRQLECKNLAGLMYVLASERHKSKLEIMRITEQYTNYIQSLQNVLSEGQALILHLSRGYKTAARVNHEWRQKMEKVMKEFQNFVYHFAGGTRDTNQYFFDMPDLLKIEAPLVDNPAEDPCEVEEEEENVKEELPREKLWWEKLEGDDRPFVMFGDMAEFQPSQRREVLRTVKANKTAPKKWKEYVFNEMFLNGSCPNAHIIKDEYFKHLPASEKFDCQANQNNEHRSNPGSDSASRRMTTTSVDIRGNMGSILKIMTANNPQAVTKATLLGAKDSIEIASATKLREKHKTSVDHSKVVLNIGSRKASMFEQLYDNDSDEIHVVQKEPLSKEEEEEDVYDESTSALGSLHNDSIHVIAHVPDQDHKINYEKVCPMEECQRLQVDSFIRSLPPYMRANPFTHFEQTYEEYEPCTPEQLEILKARIEEKRKKEKVDFDNEEKLLDEWTPSIEGVAIQTSELSLSLPPCTCRTPCPTQASSTQRVFTLSDLIPVKEQLNQIHRECFFDDGIDFDRFKVIGEDSHEAFVKEENERDFRRKRLNDIQKVLKQHPSLCEIFQANIRC